MFEWLFGVRDDSWKEQLEESIIERLIEIEIERQETVNQYRTELEEVTKRQQEAIRDHKEKVRELDAKHLDSIIECNDYIKELRERVDKLEIEVYRKKR